MPTPAFLPTPWPTRPKTLHPPRRPPLTPRTPPVSLAAATPPDTNSDTSAPNLTDWRAFRARLHTAATTAAPPTHHAHKPPRLWAHALPTVEPGCTLLARASHRWPASFRHLEHAVILVTDTTPTGLQGLLLNRPTRFRVGTHASVLARAGRPFAGNRVHLGGDCSTGTLEMLHSLSPEVVAGAEEIAPGVSRGGFNASRALVASGMQRADAFHFFVAYSRWSWEQFQAEMAEGAWLIASCAPPVLLGPHLEDAAVSPERFWRRVSDLVAHGG